MNRVITTLFRKASRVFYDQTLTALAVPVRQPSRSRIGPTEWLILLGSWEAKCDVLAVLMELTPVLAGLEAARAAAVDAIHPDDEVTMDDQSDRWMLEFIPNADVLGGGACVAGAKADLCILSATRGQ